jgi:glutathione synthase/RimK-type ligase-like ATP-grasp enzyme
MTICVLGDTNDLSSVYLAWAARRAGHRVLQLDEEALGSTWSFAFDDGRPFHGVIETGARTERFGDLIGVFARFDPEPGAPPGVEFDPLTLQRFRAERRFALYQLLDRLPCPVANRPSAGRSNGSKPLQMAMLEAAGFQVPSWLVSNERESVVAFLDALDGPAIYKAVSGLRSRVRSVDEQLLQRLEAGTTPVVIQAYIGGVDVRVHVIAEQCFGTEVRGLGVDYRFDGSKSYWRREVPPRIAALCREVAGDEGLLLSGFDFRVDAEGEWFCLEVNPMPSFIPYQWATGQPIGEALIQSFVGDREISRYR